MLIKYTPQETLISLKTIGVCSNLLPAYVWMHRDMCLHVSVSVSMWWYVCIGVCIMYNFARFSRPKSVYVWHFKSHQEVCICVMYHLVDASRPKSVNVTRSYVYVLCIIWSVCQGPRMYMWSGAIHMCYVSFGQCIKSCECIRDHTGATSICCVSFGPCFGAKEVREGRTHLLNEWRGCDLGGGAADVLQALD